MVTTQQFTPQRTMMSGAKGGTAGATDMCHDSDLTTALTSEAGDTNDDKQSFKAPASQPPQSDQSALLIQDGEEDLEVHCIWKARTHLWGPCLWKRPRGQDYKPGCASSSNCWRFACSSAKRQCFSLLVTLLVLIVVLLPLVIWVIVPAQATHYVQGATIRLVHAQLSDFSPSQAHLNATVVIGNAGPFDASLDSFEASLSYGGVRFGSLPFPSMKVDANKEHTIHMSAQLRVDAAAAMAQSLKPAMKGEPSLWQVGGSVDVTIMGFLKATVDLENAMPLPSLKLEAVNAYNLEPRSGDGATGEFISDVEMSFFSTSIMEVSGLGTVTLDYYSANGVENPDSPDATAAKHKVGIVTIPNFGIRRGLNRFNASFTGKLYQNSSDPKYNYEAIATIFQKYSSQEINLGLVQGPISASSGADFLLNVLSQTFTMAGSPVKMFPSALLNNASTIQGYNPINGKPCAVLADGGDLDHCLRGSMITGVQSFQKRMRYSDFVMDTFWDNPLPGYKFEFNFYGIPASAMCRSTNVLGRQISPAGVVVSDEGAKPGSREHEFTVGGLTRSTSDIAGWDKQVDSKDFTFFLGSTDAPGQAAAVVIPNPDGSYPKPYPDDSNRTDYRCFGSLGPLDCCQTSSFTAAVCLAKQRGETTIPVTATGNVTTYLDTWVLNISSTQHMDLSFDDALLFFDIFDHELGMDVVNWNCSSFIYTKE